MLCSLENKEACLSTSFFRLRFRNPSLTRSLCIPLYSVQRLNIRTEPRIRFSLRLFSYIPTLFAFLSLFSYLLALSLCTSNIPSYTTSARSISRSPISFVVLCLFVLLSLSSLSFSHPISLLFFSAFVLRPRRSSRRCAQCN